MDVQPSSGKKFLRLLLKISGESFGSHESSLNDTHCHHIARELKTVQEAGNELCVIVGGGNIIRGAAVREHKISRVTADQMGMLATVINTLALRDILEQEGCRVEALSAIPVGGTIPFYTPRKCQQYLQEGYIVLLAGGTGSPYFSTDTAAALRAAEVGASFVLKATKVDGVYSADPKIDPQAQRFSSLTYLDVLNNHYQVMDATAITFCMEYRIPILVFDLTVEGNILRAIQGEHVGTIISDH